MAEVYIDSLTLENFGPFYGEHTFNFGNLDGSGGILVGGKNGAGKTHLLRALYLAVVGESGVGDLKRVETGSDATRFIFDKSLNRRAQAEGQDTMRLAVTFPSETKKVLAAGRWNLFAKSVSVPNSAPGLALICSQVRQPGPYRRRAVDPKIARRFSAAPSGAVFLLRCRAQPEHQLGPPGHR